MPTGSEREYYRMGYADGLRDQREGYGATKGAERYVAKGKKVRRKLSAWNKYVKANSKKPRFRYRNGKLNLKKMAIAFRKTPQGKKEERRLFNALKDKFTGVTPPITNGKPPSVPDVPTVTPPSTTPTLFGDDPFVFLFPPFIPDPEFIVDISEVPQCAFGEKLTWIPAQEKYVCLPKS